MPRDDTGAPEDPALAGARVESIPPPRVVLLVALDTATVAVWRDALRQRYVTDVHSCASGDEARTLLSQPGRPAWLVVVDIGGDSHHPGPRRGERRAAPPCALLAGLPTTAADREVVIGPATADLIRAVLTGGARGYLFAVDRTAPAATSQAAHRRAVTGSQVLVHDAAGGPSWLSRREIHVLQALAEGHSNGDIAEHLGLSSLTIKSHLARVTRRLAANDRAHLVLLALRAGAIT